MKWFVGVVENTKDPLEQGRLQVRAFGYHTDDKNDIPTEDLPWATVMVPLTQSGVGGIGSSIGVTQGVWVCGFFTDNTGSQDMIIMGSLPSSSWDFGEYPDTEGFHDPDKVHPKRGGNDLPDAATSQYQTSASYDSKVKTRKQNVPTATRAKVSTLDNTKSESDFELKSWSVPDPTETNKPSYPMNRVHSTVSGHTIELDDTPGSERISQFHPSGTYTEVQSDGTEVTYIKGSSYRVVVGGNNVLVEGECNLTINGDCRTYVKGDYHLEVNGDYTETIRGSRQSKIGVNNMTEVINDNAMNIGGKDTKTIYGDKIVDVAGEGDYTFARDLDMFSGGLRSDSSVTGHDIKTVGSCNVLCGSHLVEGPLTVLGGYPTQVTGSLSATGAINTPSTVTAGNDVVSGTITLKNHVHGGVQTGSGLTSTSTPTP